jgi:hypothetical protein
LYSSTHVYAKTENPQIAAGSNLRVFKNVIG